MPSALWNAVLWEPPTKIGPGLLALTFFLCWSFLPANAGFSGQMPESTTPTTMPLPAVLGFQPLVGWPWWVSPRNSEVACGPTVGTRLACSSRSLATPITRESVASALACVEERWALKPLRATV